MFDALKSLPEVLVFIPVLLSIFLLLGAISVARYAFHRMKSEQWDGPPGWLWQSLLFVIVMELVLFAGMDVAKFREFFLEGWGGIVGVTTSLFAPWMLFKAVKVTAAAKEGSTTTVDSQGGGT